MLSIVAANSADGLSLRRGAPALNPSYLTHPSYLIGGAVFSAGAGGNAGFAPASLASASGRAGCGGVSCGRCCPVVAGSAGAAGLLSAPGVDCRGGVACASRDGGGLNDSPADANVGTTATTTTAIARHRPGVSDLIELMGAPAI